jgi:putative hydroxymethylpyrimidine transport system substrate-binding protein
MQKIISLFFILFLLVYAPVSLAQKKSLTLVLEWLANPDHAVLFIAQEQGFFAKEGLNVKLIAPADPDDGVKLVAAGHADLAVTYQPQFVRQIAQGLPLARIATLIDRPLNCLIVRKDEGIDHLIDLKGKTIGYSSQSEGILALSQLLASAGLKISDVRLINVQYNLIQGLLTHRLDAIVNVMRNVEPLELEALGQPVTVFPVEPAMPAYDELILVAHRSTLHAAYWPHFLKALQAATDYVLEYPEQSWRIFARHHPTLNNDLNHKIWEATLPYLAKHPGTWDKKQEEAFTQFLKENGKLT